MAGKELADSEVRKILKESKNSAERKDVWEASKGVGPLVEADLKELVKLRNQVAKGLGFPSYHALQLHLNEQSQTAVIALFDELDALTRGRSSRRRPRSMLGWQKATASRPGTSSPGTSTTLFSRKRRPYSTPTSTRPTRRPIL